MRSLYYEDLGVGDTRAVGEYTFTRENIIDFAEEYDPQPFPLHDEGVEDSVFDTLVASGLQTIAHCCRVTTENFLNEVKIMGGGGMEEALIVGSMEPGDALSVELKVEDKRVLGTYPGLGLVRIRVTGRDQTDEEVASVVILPFVKLRDPE
jgi:acyl dehydratase